MVEKATVEEWLEIAGFEYGDAVVEAPAADDFRWALNFAGGNYLTFAAQRDVEPNWVVMQVSVTIADSHLAILRKLSEDVRDRFIFDLRIALLDQPVGQQLRFHDEDPEILAEITIGLHVLEDPLQMSGFFRRNHQLQSAAMLGAQMMRKLARFEDW